MERIKGWSEGWVQDLLYMLVVLLVAISAFGLGRISAGQGTGSKDIIRVYPAATTTEPMLKIGGRVVAQMGSGVYFGPWCGQVKNIAPAKMVWFKSSEEARSEGYKPGACKGTQ